MVVNKISDTPNYDIVIVGGGILGVLCAYYANLKWPDKKIAILEKGLIGKGVTDYSAYLDVPYSTTPYKQKLTRESRLLYDELLIKYPHLPITAASLIGICNTNKIHEVINNLSSRKPSIGSREKFQEHVPDDFQLMVQNDYFYNTSGHYAYGNVAPILASELIKKDTVTIYESTKVKDITEDQNRYLIQTNYGLHIETTAVIDATGPWMTKGFSQNDILSDTLRIKKIVALHINAIPWDNAPILYFFDDDAFLCPQPHASRWLFSYRCNDWDFDIDTDEFEITEKNVSNAIDVLNKYNPAMKDKIIGGRVHCDVYSSNGDPIVKKTKTNYTVVGAPGGSGFRLAPGIATEAISLLDF